MSIANNNRINFLFLQFNKEYYKVKRKINKHGYYYFTFFPTMQQIPKKKKQNEFLLFN